MNKKEPVYYIEKKLFGMIIKVPVKASEIEALYNQVVLDAQATVTVDDSPEETVFGNAEELHR